MLVTKVGTLLTVANAVVLCLLVSRAPVVDSTTTDGEEQHDSPLAANDCDCGPHSTGCKLQNGSKVCKCEYLYRQEGEICKAFCNKHYQCDNGAHCVNESCQCLPGTRGDFCKTVDECEGVKGPLLCGDPEIAFCDYDEKTHKSFCSCRIYDYLFYPPNRTCVECDCGEFGSCTLVDGKKTCKCNEDAALRQVHHYGDIVTRCDECKCGNNSDGCSFDGTYTKICNCKNGTAQQRGIYGDDCTECNCGPNGQCYFKGWYRHCNCNPGYKPFLTINDTDLYCEECDCGKNGECSFKNEVKQCKCNPGYALRKGICTACQCYAGNKTVDCTFTDRIQTCLCPDGYETSKFFCKDIDECLNNSNSCPSTTKCVNTMGSYECTCEEGYEPRIVGGDPKIEGCVDIDECEDPDLCPSNNTICQDFPGTYSCTCKRGYVPVHPNTSPKVAGCEIDKPTQETSGWTHELIILAVFICICVVGIVIVIVRCRYTNRTAHRMETPHEMKKLRNSNT